MRAWLLLLLLASSLVLAVAKGGALFIKSEGVSLLAEPRAGARKVVALPVGTRVIWNGPSEKDKVFHKVTTAEGKTGFVMMANLSPTAPSAEPSPPAKPIDFGELGGDTGPYDHCFTPQR